MRRIKLYIALIVVIYGCCSSSASEEDYPCEVSRDLQEKCGKFAYRVVHPLLDYIRQFRQQINDSEAKDREIKELQNKLIQEQRNTVTTNDLRAQIVFQQSTINRLMANTNPKTTTENCELVKSALADKAAKLKENENQLASLNHKLTKKTLNLQQCQSEVTKFKTQPNSCVAFGKTGIHQIQIAGLDAFDVLCDNETAGPGWLVIEQRINGGESFNRDWATFRKGFGRFEGDFFLGLEKIHRLSVDRFNELYIHMERFDGRVDYARYDRFVVGNENDKYRLNILGDFSGNVDDKLMPHSNMQFSTLDSDNDSWEGGSCATYRDAGWWYDSCVHSFLHGTYFDHKSDSYSAIYFNYPHSIRKLKIMMRPFEAPDVK